MTSWIITVPKTIKWSDYQKELKVVSNGSAVMNYKLPFKAKAKPGERCYIVYDGKVRGWMRIVGVETKRDAWVCSTTGKEWPSGFYLQRTGPFHGVNGPAVIGFQGIRRFEMEIKGDSDGQDSVRP